MKLELYAMIEMDGTAIVEIENKDLKGLYLVRPPYDEKRFVRFDEKDLSSAVCKDGFSMAQNGTKFENYESLFKFLNQTVAETRKQRGRPVPSQEELEKEIKQFLAEGGQK